MGAESKDPENFYRTNTASGNSTNALSLKKPMPFAFVAQALLPVTLSILVVAQHRGPRRMALFAFAEVERLSAMAFAQTPKPSAAGAE
jgi:hypothetical protein